VGQINYGLLTKKDGRIEENPQVQQGKESLQKKKPLGMEKGIDEKKAIPGNRFSDHRLSPSLMRGKVEKARLLKKKKKKSLTPLSQDKGGTLPETHEPRRKKGRKKIIKASCY